MNRIPIGQFIRERREAMGITQEMLCGNICDVTTLSHIENGTAFPRNVTLHDLLERLGVPDSYCIVPIDEYENRIRPEACASACFGSLPCTFRESDGKYTFLPVQSRGGISPEKWCNTGIFVAF